MFGASCETIIPDFSQPNHPILAIYNGHGSGRQVGSTRDLTGLEQEVALQDDVVNLLATTPSGQKVKSSTFVCAGRITISRWRQFRFYRAGLRQPPAHGPHARGRGFPPRVYQDREGHIGEIFAACVEASGKPVCDMSKADRLRVIGMLENAARFPTGRRCLMSRSVWAFRAIRFTNILTRSREGRSFETGPGFSRFHCVLSALRAAAEEANAGRSFLWPRCALRFVKGTVIIMYKKKIDAYFTPEVEQEMIKALSRLVAVRSVREAPLPGKPFGAGPAAALAEALELCGEMGFRTRNYENYVGTADLSDKPAGLDILGHLDVVGEGTGWDTDPYAAVLKEDGMLYGRGTATTRAPSSPRSLPCARCATWAYRSGPTPDLSWAPTRRAAFRTSPITIPGNNTRP
jgi:hypothetical protein